SRFNIGRRSMSVSAGLKKRQLLLRALPVEVGNCDTQEPDAQGGWKERPQKIETRLPQVILRQDRGREATAPRDLAAIGKFNLPGHCPPEGLSLRAPSPTPVRHGLQAGLDVGRLGQIVSEGGFGAR